MAKFNSISDLKKISIKNHRQSKDYDFPITLTLHKCSHQKTGYQIVVNFSNDFKYAKQNVFPDHINVAIDEDEGNVYFFADEDGYKVEHLKNGNNQIRLTNQFLTDILRNKNNSWGYCWERNPELDAYSINVYK